MGKKRIVTVRRVLFVAGLGAGYVLGARAGRERYEQIVSLAKRVAASPPAQKAGDFARTQLESASESVARFTGQLEEKSRELPGKLVHTAESLRADLKRRAAGFSDSIDDAQAQRLFDAAERHSDAMDELESDDDSMIDTGNADERNLNQSRSQNESREQSQPASSDEPESSNEPESAKKTESADEPKKADGPQEADKPQQTDQP